MKKVYCCKQDGKMFGKTCLTNGFRGSNGFCKYASEIHPLDWGKQNDNKANNSAVNTKSDLAELIKNEIKNNLEIRVTADRNNRIGG